MAAICLVHYFFSIKISDRLSIKKANIIKIFNNLKSVFLLQYFYSGYLKEEKKFFLSFCAKHIEYKFGNKFTPCPKRFGRMH